MAEDKRQPHQIEEDAAEAQAILTSKAWASVTDRMRKAHYAGMLEAPIGSLHATSVHARMVALEEIERELQSLINDQSMQVRKRTK